jgi:hypothetical protein
MQEIKAVKPGPKCECECETCEIGYHCSGSGCENPAWEEIDPKIRKSLSERQHERQP